MPIVYACFLLLKMWNKGAAELEKTNEVSFLTCVLLHSSFRSILHATKKHPTNANKESNVMKVFLDVAADQTPLGRITVVLRDDVCPKTCENFDGCASIIFEEEVKRRRITTTTTQNSKVVGLRTPRFTE